VRILYVVQRYGDEVAGGAEQHCRDFAERLVARGHDVEVLTSCATSYVDWANDYEPGSTELRGVLVRRMPVQHARRGGLFAAFNARLVHRMRLAPLEMQREWMRMQGPYVPDLPRWLARNASAFDCVVFVTYLYWTTWAGLRAVAGAHPTVLHPTAHDEPPLRLTLFDELFRLPDALAYLTPEEAQLVAERFPGAPAGEVVGVGVDLGARASDRLFRRWAGIGRAPYLLYVGRVDPAKGAAELLDHFAAYKERSPSDLVLVLLGEQVMDVPRRADVVTTGFVDTSMRDSAVAGALALVQPSYFESFSMVVTESFAQARPALVQGRCRVLAGHARRSGAALPYSGFAEFETAVDMLLRDRALADALGRRGRAYVEREYGWDAVMARYERLLEATVEAPVPTR
jgi:glycosyltransferase involved in cell wall biosynthesis